MADKRSQRDDTPMVPDRPREIWQALYVVSVIGGGFVLMIVTMLILEATTNG